MENFIMKILNPFQDAPDLSQLEPGPVAKAKQIQQKSLTFPRMADLKDNSAPGHSMLVIGQSWVVIKSVKCRHGS